jgi:hypothetical protein
MDQNVLITTLASITAIAILFALGVFLYPRLKNAKQGYPMEAEIEAALLPLIFNGISAAYRLNEKALDQAEGAIKGADKKKIADSIYGMLPEKIGRFDVAQIKGTISQERFEQMVQDTFEKFDNFFAGHQKQFDELFEKWKADNRPN